MSKLQQEENDDRFYEMGYKAGFSDGYDGKKGWNFVHAILFWFFGCISGLIIGVI